MMSVIKKILVWTLVIITLFSDISFAQNQTNDSNKNESHQLPILSTVPSNGNEKVLLDTEVKILIDRASPNYQRFANHFKSGKYEIYVNGIMADSTYDNIKEEIYIRNLSLQPYKKYVVELRIKAELNNIKNNSQNSTFTYSFNTVLNEGQVLKVVKDEVGNEYRFVFTEGQEGVVKVTKDPDFRAEEVLNVNHRHPVSSLGAIKVDLPDNSGRVFMFSSFSKNPKTVFKWDKGRDLLVWWPFSINEENGETGYNIFEDSTFIPVAYNKEQTPMALSPSNSFRMMSIQTMGSNPDKRMFNILRNDDAYLKVELTYLKENWDSIKEDLDYSGKPELYVRISTEFEQIAYKKIDNNALSFEHRFDRSNAYKVEIIEKNLFQDTLVWEQEVNIQLPFTVPESSIGYLAKKFSPILLYSNQEQYYPLSLDNIFEQVANISNSVNFFDIFGNNRISLSDVKKFMAYNGNSNYVFSLVDFGVSKNFINIKGSESDAAVYYSYFEDDEKAYLNYHFIYGYDFKEESIMNIGSHDFDRESMTLEFNKADLVVGHLNATPVNVIVGGHLEDQDLILLGDDKEAKIQSWNNVRVKIPYYAFKSPSSHHPVVSIAKGSHAIYPVSGWYKVLTIKEGAGLVNSILSDSDLSLLGNRVIFPKDDSSFNGHSGYTLLDMDLDNLEGEDVLNFSGYWVDGFTDPRKSINESNAKFPPFTSRERDMTEWCSGASHFDMYNLPNISKRAIEEFNKSYLYKLSSVENLQASQVGRDVELRWRILSGSHRYLISREKLSNGVFVGDVVFSYGNEYTSSYIDNTVTPGETYRYNIKGIHELDKSAYGDSGMVYIYSKGGYSDSVRVEMNTGTIKGIVKIALNSAPIQGADIILDGNKVCQTDANGMFSIPVSANTPHSLRINKSGYEEVTYYDITVNQNEEKYIDTILQIPEEYANKEGSVKGRIVSALSGYGLSNITILVRRDMNNKTGDVIREVLTDSLGNFNFNSLMAGNYTAEVKGNNIISAYFNFVCIGGLLTNRGDISVTPKLSANQMRIVLSWGAEPRDLDSHFYGEGLHIAYWNKAATGVNLDVDDVNGYGPETITIELDKIKPGKYTYYVHKYAGYGSLGSSNAVVKVYMGSSLIEEFVVPPQLTSQTWDLFTLDTETGQITKISSSNLMNSMIINSTRTVDGLEMPPKEGSSKAE